PLFCYKCVIPAVTPLPRDCIRIPTFCPPGQSCLSSRATAQKGNSKSSSQSMAEASNEAQGDVSVSLDGDESEETSEVFLSVLVHHGQVGLSFYDSKDCTLYVMADTVDNRDLSLLDRIIQELSPCVLITSAKQERSLVRFIRALGSNPDYRPEIVVYPNADFGLEVSKQRLLLAHLPFLPPSITEKDRIPYLSSLISFDSVLMASPIDVRTIGALLKCLDRRRVGVELEESTMAVPILQFLTYTLADVVYMDKDAYSVLQIFKFDLHPSVYKLQSGQKEGLSLYGILNRCRCTFGSRLLRQWFHRPTRDLSVLRRRQEVIRFFTSPHNSELMSTLQSFLRNVKNIPVLLRKMSLSHTKVVDWQNLYKTVYSAVGIRDTVRSLPQTIQLFREISEEFTDDLHYVATLISKVVDFEGSLAENRFTIKPNVDPAIDEKKRRIMGLSDFLTDVARAELESLDSRFSSCSVIYIPLIGFLLSVPRLPGMVEKENFEMEGLDFIFVSEDRLHYRSARTKELDNMLGDLHCDIRDMEMAVMTQLQATVLQRSSCLYKMLSLYAELDCLMSLAQASQDYGYCAPTYTERCTLNLQHARHPLLELCTSVFVANPCVCSDTEGKVKVITGPNSSGKSIYLKQASATGYNTKLMKALLFKLLMKTMWFKKKTPKKKTLSVGLIVFMALIGSDVPAKEAEIGLIDGIFTRMQSRESVSLGLSTFMIDLNQMAHALNYSTGMSLVLVDEFGKGTNTVDGLSLLAACLNHWLKRTPAQCPLVFLATNFHSVLQLDLLPRSPLLSLLTLETAIDKEELIFLYQLKEGICQSSYAANIATLAGLPPALVQRGLEVSELYRTGKTIQRVDQPSSEELISRQWWDHGKVLIQQLCREYTVNITRDITKSLKDLEIGLVELQALAESTGDRRHVEDLKVKKVLMADLLGTKAQDLYRSERRDNKELLDTFYQGLPQVSSEDNAALEGPLVLEELQVAPNTMPGGKAPGIDGLPVEFYKFFWKELGEDLLEVLEESCRKRCLPLSSRRAVITLLPKKGDLQDIKNWRPVSLLCTDYKIMSKALANRLRDIVDSLILTDQTYCVPNRSIIDNVSLIQDILDVSRSLAVDLGLITLDQEKAFDRVEHQYLWKTLEAFGLSPSLIAMMKVLYQDVESVLKINGGLSAPFKVQRGIRQGCSLSAWTLFKRGSHGPAVSLYWLLEEPLVGGGHMDIKDSSPGLTHITQSRQFTTLKRLVDTAGPEFEDTRAVAEELGLRSLWRIEDIIQRWTNKLPEDELNLIKEYHDGTETPDRDDPFPELELLPDLNGYEGICENMVEKFLSLDLDDPSTDLQSFLKDELLPTVGEVL
ncbi:hypothetical protein QTP86_019211, partial [Hemibagrus guttatus]